jgi:hypothetical protein
MSFSRGFLFVWISIYLFGILVKFISFLLNNRYVLKIVAFIKFIITVLFADKTYFICNNIFWLLAPIGIISTAIEFNIISLNEELILALIFSGFFYNNFFVLL